MTGGNMRRFIFAAAVLLCCVSGVMPGEAFSADVAGAGSLYPDVVPAVSAEDVSGRSVNLSEEAGRNRILLVNFWGVRCGACIEEMGALDAIYGKYGGKGFDILAVNVDGIDSATIIAQLAKVKEMPKYRLLPDPDFRLVELFRMSAAPLTVLFDSKGKAVYRHEGYAKGDEVEIAAVIEKELASPK